MCDQCIPEFFVSRLEHVENMGDGNARFWFAVDRELPGGEHETDTACIIIMPLSAIPPAAAMRKEVLGLTTQWPHATSNMAAKSGRSLAAGMPVTAASAGRMSNGTA